MGLHHSAQRLVRFREDLPWVTEPKGFSPSLPRSGGEGWGEEAPSLVLTFRLHRSARGFLAKPRSAAACPPKALRRRIPGRSKIQTGKSGLMDNELPKSRITGAWSLPIGVSLEFAGLRFGASPIDSLAGSVSHSSGTSVHSHGLAPFPPAVFRVTLMSP